LADYNELIEQYKKKLRQSAASTEYSTLYETAADALMNAQNASYLSNVDSLNALMPQIKEDYDAARTDVYQNARLSAVRSNEALAALGLAENLKNDPKSGVSETSRIAENNALRSNINLLNADQLKQEAEIRQKIADAGYENDAVLAEILAQYAEQLAAYKEAAREYQLKVQEYEQGLAEFEYQKQQDEATNAFKQQELEYKKQQDLAEYNLNLQKFQYEKQQDAAERKNQLLALEEEKKQTAIQNAMKEISVFGKIMTKEASDALGLPIGTMSYQVEQKSLKSSSGKSSSKSSAKLSENVQAALDGAAQRMNIPTDTYSAAYNASLYGIKADDLPEYQADQYLKGLVRQRTITEKQAEKVRALLGI